jgi:malate dehydrogenase (oxaloacetate-decarboxylating)(NADP+)
VLRVDRKRAVDDRGGLPRELAALRHRERIGPVGEDAGVVGQARGRLRVRVGGFLEALQRAHRAAEEEPAARIVGLLLHALGEPLDHRDDLGLGGARTRGGRVERLRVAEREVGDEHHRGQQRDDRDRDDPRGALRRLRGGARRRRGELVAEPRDDFLVRPLALVGVDHAGRDVVVELARLVAVDRGGGVGLGGAGPLAGATKQRDDQRRQRRDDERERDQPEQDAGRHRDPQYKAHCKTPRPRYTGPALTLRASLRFRPPPCPTTNARSARPRSSTTGCIRRARSRSRRPSSSPTSATSRSPTRPGVAAACEEIVRDPAEARNLTARGNLIGVVTNGTAVLGLGAIGPLAGKPVMEGKAVLFKKFAGIDCFDIELDERDPDKLVDMICALEPTFGGINLEDIKAPECFYIERMCRERMKIPVFHDDQHGTAIIVGAAVLNGLRVVGKEFADVKLVCSGAGAAALACLDLLVSLGIRRENIWVSDIKGVVYEGRVEEMDDNKARYAQRTDARALKDILPGADIFLGLSAARVLKQEWLAQMAAQPLILALANPEPEIMPDIAKAARPDAVIATGRSDFPNQVNNVLCFPFIFRGALDVGATTINEPMKLAAVRAIADLAMAEQIEVVAHAYNLENIRFGPEYLIPKPFDPRLIVRIAPAVAKAAMESGVATRPIEDFDAYVQRLTQFVYASGLLMKPIFSAAKAEPRRIVYAEGEDERVLRAVQVVVDEGLAKPILVGRPAVLQQRIERFGLRLQAGKDFEAVNPEQDDRYREYWQEYHRLAQRRGISQDYAKIELRRRNTLIGAMMIHMGDADGMLCGMFGTHAMHRRYVDQVIGLKRGVRTYAAMNALMMTNRTIFIADTYVNPDPDRRAARRDHAARGRRDPPLRDHARRSRSCRTRASARATSRRRRRCAHALALVNAMDPELEVDGEMHGDAALSEEVRLGVFPNARSRARPTCS